MIRKGKFKLFSYVIEDYLIFYKSINKNRKYIAFSMIKAKNVQPLTLILTKFLEKRFLNYFSLQIDIYLKINKFFILNFSANEKDLIIKFFNIIYQELIQYNGQYKFLKKKNLETRYLHFFHIKLNQNIKIVKMKDSLMAKDHEFKSFLNFYTLNFFEIQNKIAFIDNLIQLVHKISVYGQFIFNFKINNENELIFGGYFVEVQNNTMYRNETQQKINNFYNFNLLLKQNLELNKFYYYLWRFELFNNYNSYKNYSDLFFFDNQYDFQNEFNFNSQFESNLIKNRIKFKRLNKNLLFIEDTVLFHYSFSLDPKYFLNILERFYSKYFIIIILLNEKQNSILLEKIGILKNVKILNPTEFSKFDLKILKNGFKNQNNLENT